MPYNPAPESHLLDLNTSHETPAEEFRTLRTRLNHLQTLQPLHTVVVTSPSPAEGKTFSSVNLALAQAHLTESSVLLGDFDLRRPIIHNLLQIDRSPGLSDYITGACSFAQALRKVQGTNLYLLPAGTPVKNPLELLNMRQCQAVVRRSAAPLQLGDLRYSAAAVFGGREPAVDHGGRHHSGGQDRHHHLRHSDNAARAVQVIRQARRTSSSPNPAGDSATVTTTA